MNINSTEQERYEELKNKTLKIVHWDDNQSLIRTNPNETTKESIKRFSQQFNLTNKKYHLQGLENIPVSFSNISIKESIVQFKKQRSNLDDLPKLFTVFDDVVNNAILLEIEPFRHNKSKPQKASIIESEYQYLSAFYDEKRVYPVKISVEKYNDKHIDNSKMYLVITVGNIKRENISFTRMQPKGESVCPEIYSPSEISITDFVKYFKPNECGCLIVNLPDGMLDEMQKNKKEHIKQNLEQKENKLANLYQDIKHLENEIKYLESENEYDEWER